MKVVVPVEVTSARLVSTTVPFSAGRPLIGEWPGYASLGMGGLVLYMLLVSAPAWKGDTPPDVATDIAPLGEK